MQYSATSGLWSLHQAVDLKAAPGQSVYAVEAGSVAGCGSDPLNGTYVVIRHADGYESSYGGLSALAGIKVSDKVKAGQTIGFAGNSKADEAELGSHLHFSLRNDLGYINPELCWK